MSTSVQACGCGVDPWPDEEGSSSRREELWLGRALHRAWFAMLACGPWRARALGRVFELLHRSADPWGYHSDPYEHRKAATAVDATAGLCPRSILEVGCADGHLAVRLLDAHPEASLTAVDIAPTAVAAAQRRLSPYGARARAVQGEASSFSDSTPADLVVFSEVLYYFGGPSGIRRALQGFPDRLAPDADVLMVHPAPEAGRLHAAVSRALNLATHYEARVDHPRRPFLVTLARRCG